ncbi:hypothetical protein CDEST_15067 [Colletotrichum destructivum]|uniref:Lipocalin-like domain-containing protein n=1 Tax=Colletotrichum destructivum TaxID=34406 RepID=A0AAX4J3S4_9PEZI|nr:hypothetical protein CDEST_15067 [Colletotrichum destructivum]
MTEANSSTDKDPSRDGFTFTKWLLIEPGFTVTWRGGDGFVQLTRDGKRIKLSTDGSDDEEKYTIATGEYVVVLDRYYKKS